MIGLPDVNDSSMAMHNRSLPIKAKAKMGIFLGSILLFQLLENLHLRSYLNQVWDIISSLLGEQAWGISP